MQLPNIFQHRRRDRFARFNIVVPILLAGWVPSILALVVSYTILSKTLESKILRDRQTFVKLIAHLVGDDLNRTGGIIEYYQTLPDIAQMFAGPDQQTAAQRWLASVYYSHPRIDGMFVTASDGVLIASLPNAPDFVGKDFESDIWRQQAEKKSDVFVSPVHRRLPDKRLATDIVGAVRSADRTIVGYLGISVLVERIGRRLSTIELGDQSLCEVFDQNGVALFDKEFKPNLNAASAGSTVLMAEIAKLKRGHFELQGNLYSFSPVESTGWIAVVEQPKAIAYQPVRDLLRKMNFLVGWLLVATAAGALGASKLFQRQNEANKQIEREVVFNKTILANMPTGIAFVDPVSKHFRQANEAFTQLARRFGQLPVDRAVTDAHYQEVKIAPAEAIDSVLAAGTAFHLAEHPIKDRNGMTHFLDIQLIRLEGSDKKIQGLLYLVEDKTRDIQLRQELIGANAAKDQFLALLSHELRNPLTPVLAMVSELEATLPDSEAVREALDVIRRNVELEARLIDDLLDLTRIAKGKMQLSFEIVNVHEILRCAYEICRDEIAAKQLETEFVINAADAHIQGDPARLQQVFWNLIKNSVKFTPENGRIRIETLNAGTDEIEIRITDTGIGIEPEKIDKIFNAFEQGQLSITRRFGGLGLGLAISRAMVDAHGGKINVLSPGKGRGATFSVKLKTVSAPLIVSDGEREPQTTSVAEKEPAEIANRRLLLVDDHEDTCIGMKRMLERRGYQITVAHSADQAVEKSRAQEFDLLISDIGLPDRSGYELMRELSRSKGLRGIALTGFGMEHDVNKARAAGFSEHLTKPINFERLEQAIRQLLA